jgi:propanediol dehydratase small subunit
MPSRPIVVQFKSESEKVKALEDAAKLRHSLRFKDVLIRPDLTKAQRELNKLSEAALKAEAFQRNAALSNTEKDFFHWVILGRPGRRRVFKKENLAAAASSAV